MNKKYNEFVKKIKEYGTIIIHRHNRPDGDAIGSQIGLKEAILASFPYKKVYVVGDENERFQFLGRMDDVKDEVFSQALAIVLDSGDDYLVSDTRYKLARYTIRVDHHLYRSCWTDFEIIEPDEVSCSSMLAKIFLQTGMKINASCARALYTGIVTDSGRFRYEGTNSALFDIVSRLCKYDFDMFDVYNRIYSEDLDVVKLRAQLTLNFKISKGGVAYLINTQEDIKKIKQIYF